MIYDPFRTQGQKPSLGPSSVNNSILLNCIVLYKQETSPGSRLVRLVWTEEGSAKKFGNSLEHFPGEKNDSRAPRHFLRCRKKHVTRSGNKYHPLFALESSVTKKPWTVSVSCLPIPTGYDVYRFTVQEYAKPEGIQSIRVPPRNFYSSKNERNRDFLNSEIWRKPKSFQKSVPLRIERNIVSLIKRCGNRVNENCFSRDMVRSQ